MEQAVEASYSITTAKEFREIERLRSRARHNEASALRHAAEVARANERAKWQGIVAEQDAFIAKMNALIAEQDALTAKKEALIKEYDAFIVRRDAYIAQLRAQPNEGEEQE